MPCSSLTEKEGLVSWWKGQGATQRGPLRLSSTKRRTMSTMFRAKRRLLGCQRALFEAGIPYNPSWVLDANWEPEKAYTMTAKLVNAGVDAIFCMSDWMAGGVYNCIHDMGLEVGKDIAVTGFDNEKVANWYIPKMTSSRLPLLEVGTESARLLFEKIEKQDSDDNGADSDTVKHIKIPCEIKIRESVPKRNE